MGFPRGNEAVRRALVTGAVIASLASPAIAQPSGATGSWGGTPRPGIVTQAVKDTLNANLLRRNIPTDMIARTQQRVTDALRTILDVDAWETVNQLSPVIGGNCSGGAGSITCTGGTVIGAWAPPLSVGSTYRFSFSFSRTSGGSLRFNNSANNEQNTLFTGIISGASGSVRTPKFQAQQGSFSLQAEGATFSGNVTNFLLERRKTVSGGPAGYLCATSPAVGWFKLLDCGNVPMPYGLGAPGYKLGGDYGGGGASAGWDDCGDVDYRLDAEGNLIIPAIFLDAGSSLPSVYRGYPGQKQPHYAMSGGVVELCRGGESCGKENGIVGYGPGAAAGEIGMDNPQMRKASVKRYLHLLGLKYADKRDWWAPVRYKPNGCVDITTVAYRRNDGVLAKRRVSEICTANYTYDPNYEGEEPRNKGCPGDGSGGGDFHYYSLTPNLQHQRYEGCVAYYPRPDVTGTKTGYAYSDYGALALDDLKNLPEHVAKCPIDPALIAKMTEIALDKASKIEGYDGASPAPIPPSDAKPGDTRVGDLPEPPSEPQVELPPNETPPPTPPSTGTNTDPPPGGGSTLGCMFTSCNDPGVAANEQTAQTNFLDPLFNWLPKFDQLNVSAMSSACPTWAINLTEFGGPGWQFLLNGHCQLLEYDGGAGSVASLLSALFVALWGFAAALIILRA